VIFVSRRGSESELYALDWSNGERVRLTYTDVVEDDPCWSPGGDQIAFSSLVSGRKQLFEMNADGTGLRQLTSGWGHARFPDYSPDGTAIVYELSVGALDHRAVTTIHVLDLTSGRTTPLARFGQQASAPRWADGGRQVVFTRTGPDEIHSQIYIMPNSGGDGTSLTSSAGNDHWPAVSPSYR